MLRPKQVNMELMGFHTPCYLLYQIVNVEDDHMYISTLSQRYLNEVHEQRWLEHPVQPHVTIGQQVGQTSSRAVLHCQGKDPSVQEETQIQIHIFMSHLPQLEMERHIETQTDTLWRSGFVVFLSNVPDGDLVTSTLTLKSIIFSLILIVKKKKTISTVC